MGHRPLVITVVGWLFIVIGVVTILGDVYPLLTADAARQLAALEHDWLTDLLPAWSVRLLGVVAGVGLLRGHNWARWLMVAWLAFHVAISAMASVQEVAVHAALSVVATYLIFRTASAAWFAQSRLDRVTAGH